VLLAAWAGAAPARAVSGGGQAVDLPSERGKRDGSGTPLKAPIKGIG
jgi:DNA gyrase subunit A